MKRIFIVLLSFLLFKTNSISAHSGIPDEVDSILKKFAKNSNVCASYPNRVCVWTSQPPFTYIALEIRFSKKNVYESCDIAECSLPDEEYGLILKYQNNKLINYFFIDRFPHCQKWKVSFKRSDGMSYSYREVIGVKPIEIKKTKKLEDEAQKILRLAIKGEKIFQDFLNLKEPKEELAQIFNQGWELTNIEGVHKYLTLMKPHINVITSSTSRKNIVAACKECEKIINELRSFIINIARDYFTQADYFKQQEWSDWADDMEGRLYQIKENKVLAEEQLTLFELKTDPQYWEPFLFYWENKKITCILANYTDKKTIPSEWSYYKALPIELVLENEKVTEIRLHRHD